MSGPWWFTVKYGRGQTALFNADCWSCVLLDYMKEACGYQDSFHESVDLQKEDGTNVALGQGDGKAMASETLAPKGVYVLCKVLPSEDGEGPPTYESLYELPEGEEAPAAAAPAGKKK